MSVSYIEIYDNSGYDLLDENHATKNLTDLPKVIPRETDDEVDTNSAQFEFECANDFP